FPQAKRALRGKDATSPLSLTARCCTKQLQSRNNWPATVSKLKSSTFALSNHSTPTPFSLRSRALAACFAWESHFHGAAQRRRLLRALPRKVFTCSTRRRGASTRKTPPSRIIRISGLRIVRTQKRLRERLAPCFENKNYAASSNHY